MEFEYERHGTLAYFGAYDVHRARLMGTIAPITGIAPFGELVSRVMTAEPSTSEPSSLARPTNAAGAPRGIS